MFDYFVAFASYFQELSSELEDDKESHKPSLVIILKPPTEQAVSVLHDGIESHATTQKLAIDKSKYGSETKNSAPRVIKGSVGKSCAKVASEKAEYCSDTKNTVRRVIKRSIAVNENCADVALKKAKSSLTVENIEPRPVKRFFAGNVNHPEVAVKKVKTSLRTVSAMKDGVGRNRHPAVVAIKDGVPVQHDEIASRVIESENSSVTLNHERKFNIFYTGNVKSCNKVVTTKILLKSVSMANY